MPNSDISDSAPAAAPEETIEERCRRHFNEPVIAMSEVCRCVGYAEDDHDCYYVLRSTKGRHPQFWHTAAGGIIWLDRLRGQNHVRSSTGEDWDDLTRLDSWLALNGAPRAETFIVEHENAELCPHCGRPDNEAVSCGVGGCPLGKDL